MAKFRQMVIVGIIYKQSLDSVLISRRPADKHKGEYWEFPGGKPLPGESDHDVLHREIKEETGLTVLKSHSIQSLDYDYEDLSVTLRVRVVDRWQGEVSGREGQQLVWCSLGDLHKYEFPEANLKLLNTLKLPMLYLITPDFKKYDESFYNRIRIYLENGLKLLQLRCPALPDEERYTVAEKMLKLCELYNCKIIYNGSITEARELGMSGAHLNSSRLMKLDSIETGQDFFVAASCHNEKELNKANQSNIDFCVLSPVHTTGSHTCSRSLGWDSVLQLSGNMSCPVYALGGVRHHEINRALESGCYGISMISGVWNMTNGEKVISSLGNRPSILLDSDMISA